MLRKGTIVDRYVVESLLGQGGMAEVWSARHTVLGTSRALKVLNHSTAHAESLVAEAQAQARIEHPNVLPVLDVLTHEGAPVLVMPRVNGPTLRKLMRSRRLPLEMASELFEAILDGVAAAHAQGVVHRDLKPANVLLRVRGDVVTPLVADFGIAALLDGARTAGSWGTRDYAAPEQLRGDEVGVAADFYSLGVMLFEMVVGRRPGASPEFQLAPEEIQGLLGGLLMPEPADRLVDVRRIRGALGAGTMAGAPGAERTLTAWVLAEGEDDAGPATALTGATSPTVPPVSPTTNLPTPSIPRPGDGFVGRERERAALLEALDGDGKLVTVTGLGGVGKSRLVLQWAADALSRYPGGCWFVDLAECKDGGDVVRAVAAALRVTLEDGDPGARLAGALAGRGATLVVLDSFEHVIGHAADTVGSWLDAAPDVQFLVTSREPLRLPAETVFPLDILTMPRPGNPGDAVALFVERARQVAPDFALTDANRKAVYGLVRRLDGLPLAIELAAARSATLSPRQLRERLDDRFDLLVSESDGAPERQRTLAATLDWSWSLLGAAERDALEQLSVFEGGWTLDAAEAVVRTSGRVEDLLAELVHKSLVRTWKPKGSREPRMGLLANVQAYARAKLQDQSATERRHAHWFAGLFTPESFRGPGAVERGQDARREVENYWAAARRAVRWGEGRLAMPLASVLWELVVGVGPYAASAELFRQIARVPGVPRAEILVLLAAATERTGNAAAAERWAREAAQIAQLRGETHTLARALMVQGSLLWDTTAPERAQEPFERSLALARELGDRYGEARALGSLAKLHSMRGEPDQAEALTTQAVELYRELGDKRGEAWELMNLGAPADARNPRLAWASHAALVLMQQIGDRRGRAFVHQNLAALAFDQGDQAVASKELSEAVRLFRLVGDRKTEGRRQKLLARILLTEGRVRDAHAALDAGEAALRPLGDTIGLGLLDVGRAEVWISEGDLGQAKASLDAAQGLIGHLAGSAGEELARVKTLLLAASAAARWEKFHETQ